MRVAGWPVTGRQQGGVLNITAAAWAAGFQWWRSGDITRTQNVSEYMLVLALCLVFLVAKRAVDVDHAFYPAIVTHQLQAYVCSNYITEKTKANQA